MHLTLIVFKTGMFEVMTGEVLLKALDTSIMINV